MNTIKSSLQALANSASFQIEYAAGMKRIVPWIHLK